MLSERQIYKNWKYKGAFMENFPAFWKHQVFHFLLSRSFAMQYGRRNRQQAEAMDNCQQSCCLVLQRDELWKWGERDWAEEKETASVWGTESRKCLCLSHRISETGKDLWRLSSPTHLLKAGSTRAVYSRSCPAGFWIFPRLETAGMNTSLEFRLSFHAQKRWQWAFCKICIEL